MVLQSSLGGRRLLTARAGYVTVRGKGALAADTTGFVFAARESRFAEEAELRLVPANWSWEGRLALGLTREGRTRSDSVARVDTSVTAITPSLAVELGRPIGGRGFAAVGAGYAHYGPTSTLPKPGSLNAVFRTYVVPEYAVYSARAGVLAFSVLGRLHLGASTAAWRSGRVERLKPTDRPASPYARPAGSRSSVSLVAGISVIGQP